MFLLVLISIITIGNCIAIEVPITLDLDIIPYEKLVEGDPIALEVVNNALHKKGIVGIRGTPGYKEAYERFITAARAFSALPEEVKERYTPRSDLGETFLGYEAGKEKFQRPNGEWVVDDLKNSYYAFIPDSSENKWGKVKLKAQHMIDSV